MVLTGLGMYLLQKPKLSELGAAMSVVWVFSAPIVLSTKLFCTSVCNLDAVFVTGVLARVPEKKMKLYR